ncbi:MAG: hypothetical protein J7J44_05560 [Deltaproteobacteria bacterium]|nr:hypothetical protein [Deltaproteobacteria bacterium]
MMECQDVTKESYPGQAPAFGMGRLSRYLLYGKNLSKDGKKLSFRIKHRDY